MKSIMAIHKLLAIITSIALSATLSCGGEVFKTLLEDNSKTTVAYNGNGATLGTVPAEPVEYKTGDSVTVLGNTGNFQRTGHTFNNWNNAPNGTGTAYSESDVFTMPERSITLYAQWTPLQYTLTYTAGSNGSISGTSPQTVDYGTSGSAVTAIPDAGYHFVQWSDGVLTAARTDTSVTGNINVTAQFSINQYTLTYLSGAHGSVSGDSPQTVNHGASGTAITAVPGSGYFFTQWSDGSTQNPRTDTNVTSNITVTAQFDSQFTLTYTAGTGGSILGTLTQYVDPNGDGSEVEAVADPGYRFEKWSDNILTDKRTEINVTANINVTAEFMRQWTLTYSAGVGGTISGSTPQTVDDGDDGSAVTANPNSGYHFVKWSDDATANPRQDTNVKSDINVSAQFASNPTVAITSAPTINKANEGNYTVSGTCSENGQVVNVKIGGGTVSASPTCSGNSFTAGGLIVSGIGDGPAISITADHKNALGISAGQASTTVLKDTAAPSGYAVNIDQSTINSLNQTAFSFTFSGAETGTTYSYTITSSAGGTPVSGSGSVSAANQQVTGINVSGLTDGTLTLTVSLTDPAGNQGGGVNDGVTKDTSPPVLQSAETMDVDNDGKIDHYKLTFSRPVKDSTFPKYKANSEGDPTDEWLIAGFADVRLLHGSAVAFAADTADDTVIYLRYDEKPSACSASDQTGCDTGDRPDLTTTVAPGLEDLVGNPLARVFTNTVTENDGARPALIGAVSLNKNEVNVIFSEIMYQVEVEKESNYGIDNGINVTDAALNAGNQKIVRLTTDDQTGGVDYTLTALANIKDLANNGVDASHNTVQFTGNVKPIVESIESYNSTTLIITFNETVTAASAECSNLATCDVIYDNPALPVMSAVSTAGGTVDSATYYLTVNPMIEGQSYTTYVLENTVTSAISGYKMANENNSATFFGDGNPGAVIDSDTSTECPTPSNLPPGSPAQTRVIVQYDQEVSATALQKANYKINLCLDNAPCSTGTGSPNSAGATAVTYMGGNRYAVDFTDPFDSDASIYQLSITGVVDLKGNAVNAPTNLGFQCGTDNTPPSLIRANVTASNAEFTSVMLTFSESVDDVTANQKTNYKFGANDYGFNVSTAVRQSNPAQVLVTFIPGISPPGGYQIRVRNVKDLVDNVILDNGINNTQPIIVNAPVSFGGGSVFEDPFGDGTKAGLIVIYDGKLYVGPDENSGRLFETDLGLTAGQTIVLDADGIAGAPISDFYDYVSTESGTIKGIDTMYAACVGGTSSPWMTGTECSTENGIETFFIGALNNSGNYRSFWHSTDVSTITTTYTFSEARNPDTGGAAAYRSTVFVLFKDQLWNHYGAELGGGGRGGRVCMVSTGCSDGSAYLAGVGFNNISRIRRIGANSANTLRNGSYNGNTFGGQIIISGTVAVTSGSNVITGTGTSFTTQVYSGQTININGVNRTVGTIINNTSMTTTNNWNFTGSGYSAYLSEQYVLNAINVMYEHDNDGAAGNESQLYMANGGWYSGTLGSARTGTSDGGIVRSVLAYSTRSSLPSECTTDGCSNYWEDVTPDANSKWNSFMSIALPQNSAVTGSGNCSTSFIEMDCTEPYNVFLPAMKAIPYMRTAPNGDLYMIRNACSTTSLCLNGKAGCDFRTVKQTCPPGSEVSQLWMMPKNCGNASECAGKWVLVAEYGASGKTNMQGQDATVGAGNTQITLLEFVGNYIYIGFDNSTDGSNIWRADMSGISSGSTPSEGAFSMVSIPGFGGLLPGSNQRIFGHVTYSYAGTDWLIITTRDGSNAVQIFRTSNDSD